MSIEQRFKDWNWKTITDGNYYQTDYFYNHASLAVLMDLRDELQRLNRLLYCVNFQNIPHTLKQIARQTKKRKYTRRNAK